MLAFFGYTLRPCLVFFLTASASFGQTNYSNARAFGMGGAYLTQAAGAEAVRWNPANLGMREAPSFSLMFASLGLGVSNNAFNQADYKLYNGARLSASDKRTILQRLPNNGWSFRMSSGADLIGFSARNMAALAGLDVISDANLPRDFVDLVLNGNALNRRYDFSSTRGSALVMATLGFSYGHPIKLPQKSLKLALGGTIKYLRGLSFFEITEARGYVLTTNAGISGDAKAQARLASGGNGLGIDFGATMIVKRQWQFGLTLHNVAGMIRWNQGVKRYEYGARADSLTLVAVEENENAVFNNASQKSTGEAFVISLPPALRVGVSRGWKQILLSADVVQGLKNEYGASQTPELHAGLEMNLAPAFALRGGLNVGGLHKIGSAVGLGLGDHHFAFDLAVGALGGVVPLYGKGMGLAMSMRVRR